MPATAAALQIEQLSFTAIKAGLHTIQVVGVEVTK